MPTVCFAPLVVLAVAGAPAPCPREFDPRSAPIERSVEAAVSVEVSPAAAELAPGAASPADAFEEAVRRLAADAPFERAAGERALASVLAPEHVARVAELLAEGGSERALRVRSALALAPRGLDLAVRIALDLSAPTPARALARDALEERVARWTPGWDRPIGSRGLVVGALAGEDGELLALDARAEDGGVARAAVLLARGARGLPPIALAPDANPAPRPRTARARLVLRGTGDVLLAQLARAHGLSIAGLGFDEDLDGRAARLVVLGPRDDETRTGLELLADACLAAANADTASARTANARFLGACGWPDAVAWMEERFLAGFAAGSSGAEGGDARTRDALANPPRQADDGAPRVDLVWLDGLSAAAERGALAPAWRRRDVLTFCARYLAEPALEPAPALRAERVAGIARALALAGPRDADGGDARAFTALAEDAGGLATWARLVAWEGRGAATDAERDELALRVARWGADAQPSSAALLDAGLRVRARLPGAAATELVLERPEAYFERASREGSVDGLVERLVAARVVPPARWDEPTALPRTWPAPLEDAACAWIARSSRPIEAVTAHVLALLDEERDRPQGRVRVAELLRTLARGAGSERIRAALAEETVRRVALAERRAVDAKGQGGGAAANESSRAARAESSVLETRLLAVALGVEEGALDPAPPAGLFEGLALGEHAARGDVSARTLLVGALGDAAALPFASAGLDWAVESLRARRDEDGERALVRAVRAAAESGSAALRARFRTDVWPQASAPAPRDLEDLAREAPVELR